MAGTTSSFLDAIMNPLRAWARINSPWAIHFNSGSCNGCDIEILATLTPRFDIERFGIKLQGSPRHADVLICTGPVTRLARERLVRIYEQMPDPKFVVAVGSCGSPAASSRAATTSSAASATSSGARHGAGLPAAPRGDHLRGGGAAEQSEAEGCITTGGAPVLLGHRHEPGRAARHRREDPGAVDRRPDAFRGPPPGRRAEARGPGCRGRCAGGRPLGLLSAITGLDLPWPKTPPKPEAPPTPPLEDQLEVLYHFVDGAAVVTLRLRVPYSDARVPSICGPVPTGDPVRARAPRDVRDRGGGHAGDGPAAAPRRLARRRVPPAEVLQGAGGARAARSEDRDAHRTDRRPRKFVVPSARSTRP